MLLLLSRRHPDGFDSLRWVSHSHKSDCSASATPTGEGAATRVAGADAPRRRAALPNNDRRLARLLVELQQRHRVDQLAFGDGRHLAPHGQRHGPGDGAAAARPARQPRGPRTGSYSSIGFFVSTGCTVPDHYGARLCGRLDPICGGDRRVLEAGRPPAAVWNWQQGRLGLDCDWGRQRPPAVEGSSRPRKGRLSCGDHPVRGGGVGDRGGFGLDVDAPAPDRRLLAKPVLGPWGVDVGEHAPKRNAMNERSITAVQGRTRFERPAHRRMYEGRS
jgi:hypothetical protein